MAEKKNPDYKETAINLINPDPVRQLLSERHGIQAGINELDALLKAYPEYEQLQAKQAELTENEQKLRQAIDLYGSYQDTVSGSYAVKQIRKTLSYITEKIRQVIPQYAEAVIDGVNKTKMNGLIKGGLITQEQADQCSEIKEDYAYIIR